MQSSRGESSFDLDRAREISRRLAGAVERPVAEAGPAAPPPRFSAEQVKGPGGAPVTAQNGARNTPPRGTPRAVVPPPPAAAPVRVPPIPTSGGYDAIAVWCQQVLSAEAVFFLDDRGLLVASVGNVPAQTAEAMGARMVFTFEQADAMREGGERTKSISVEFAGSWLTGWRFAIENVVLTVIAVTPKPLPANVGTLVAKAFAQPIR